MQALLLALFALGFLVMGAFSTRTELLFSWPSLALLGVPALLSLACWKHRPKFSPSDLCLLATTTAAAYFAGRAFLSPVAYLGRTDLALVGGCFLIYALVSTVFASAGQRRVIFWVVAAIAAGNLVVAAIHVSGNWGFHILPYYLRTYAPGRVGGFYNNPNHLAAALEAVMFLALGLACFGRGGAARRLLLLFFASLCAMGILASVSRGAMLSSSLVGLAFLFAAVVLFWFLYPFQFGRISIGAGIALVAITAAALYLGPQIVAGRFSLDRVVDTRDVRTYLWEAARSQHDLAPMTGTGARSFEYHSREFRPEGVPGHINDAIYTHNDWLQARAEYGWIGLALISLVLALHLANAGRFVAWFIRERLPGRTTPGSAQLGLCVGAAAALLALMVHAIFEFHIHIPSVAALAALCLGILANPGFGGRAGDRLRIPLLRPAFRLTTAGAGAALIAGAIFFLPAEFNYERARFSRPYENLGLERINFLNRAKARDPHHYAAFYESGLARINMMRAKMPSAVLGQIAEKARADFERSRQLYPANIFNLVVLGDVLDVLGLHDEAEEVFRTALAHAPEHQNVLVAFGTHYHRLGDFKKAREMYRRCNTANAYGLVMKDHLAAARNQLNRDERRAKKAAEKKNTSMR